jgi:hypothetical protein
MAVRGIITLQNRRQYLIGGPPADEKMAAGWARPEEERHLTTNPCLLLDKPPDI